MILRGSNKKHYDEGRLASITIYRAMSKRRLIVERDSIIKKIQYAEFTIPKYRLKYNYEYNRNVIAVKELNYLISIAGGQDISSECSYRAPRISLATIRMSKEEMDKKDKCVAELRHICNRIETLSPDDVDIYGDRHINRFLYNKSIFYLNEYDFNRNHFYLNIFINLNNQEDLKKFINEVGLNRRY